MTIRNILSINGPAKSKCNLTRGELATSKVNLEHLMDSDDILDTLSNS